MEKQVFVDFATRILSLEEDKKEIGTEIKEAMATFAKNNEVEVKSIKESIKAYKEYLKDKEQFCLCDNEIANIVNCVIYSELETK